MAENNDQQWEELKQSLVPLGNVPEDYDPVLTLSQNKSLVLLGEATHGTHEFYAARAEITKRLILEQDLQAVAVEADWPAAYRVNRYVQGLGEDKSARQALEDFQRFPLWMWRNTVVLQFIDWLREHNDGLPPERRVGFYGLDMYSLYESIDAVLAYLEEVDAEAAEEARRHYDCLEHVADEQQYGLGVATGRLPSCEDEVVAQLVRLQRKAPDYVSLGGMVARDEQFQAEQNARLVRNAENYYRAMFGDRVSTWNLRDEHMTDTLVALRQHLSARSGGAAKLAVWEHNSHLGDARATQMGYRGEHNVGQLTRERFGEEALLVGFTTYSGAVSAASSWGGDVEHKAVPEASPDSYEYLFHQTGESAFFLELGARTPSMLRPPRLERAIGVLYLPRSERRSHYFQCQLGRQFDAVFHFDRSRALEPLDNISQWTRETPETYPFGV